MNEDQYIEYFASLASSHHQLQHMKDGHKSFFYVEDAMNLLEFDEALRNMSGSTAMLLVAEDGELDDNESENHVDQMEGSIFILAQVKEHGRTVREARAFCKPIIMDFVAKMRKDSRKQQIIAGKLVHFRVSNLPYHKVGPMNGNWYGYMVSFRFVCPFANTEKQGIWL